MTTDPDPTVGAAPAERPFTILIVCTGNICRSPLAEQLLDVRLAALGVPARVESAGTFALVGHGMPTEAAEVSLRYGGRPEAHASRQLTPAFIAGADLVLTASREHRSEVVSLVPRASRYTFTLNQFARLTAGLAGAEQAAADRAAAEIGRPDVATRFAGTLAGPGGAATTGAVAPSDALRSFVAEVAASRGLIPQPVDPAADDIEDPYRRSQAAYDRAGVAVDAAVTAISTALGLASR